MINGFDLKSRRFIAIGELLIMESVQVAVRVRPLVASELTRGCKDIVTKTQNEPQVVVQSSSKSSDTYTFNYVFGQNETQEMIYQNSVRPLVLKLLKGTG